MNMYNEIDLNEDYFVDIELLRIEKLIEEMESYEEEFLSTEPSNDEFEYLISQYESRIENLEFHYFLDDFKDDLLNRITIPSGGEEENVDDFEENLFIPFEIEECHDQLRNEKLIEERKKYESSDFIFIDDYFAFNDLYDFQIEAREREEFIEVNGYDYDFKYEPECWEYDEYEEEMFWNLHYLRQSQFEKPNCSCAYMDYMPNDDGFCDYQDCYDYPEGPDENLSGVKYY